MEHKCVTLLHIGGLECTFYWTKKIPLKCLTCRDEKFWWNYKDGRPLRVGCPDCTVGVEVKP